ncbi:DUF402 domain-containing protein [Streptomyces sp. NBC_01551]|uniref:DUF402 domain-containing protein n=1 Tax=Streptomyces sp. NBC_01551 TaxID=2975876 RepID=UPI00224D6F45|nr:DUF402 domain-containing protein [Streptomyces sp. NBC_01551]MCX4529303.1 DUF402 domain-containing protein [Streptomyces sp. NBC_01551]
MERSFSARRIGYRRGPGGRLSPRGTRAGTHHLGRVDEERRQGAARASSSRYLAAGQWELSSWRWQETAVLLWNPPGTYFTINAFYDPTLDHRLLRWYVNFQRPLRRTSIGFDTFDLFLDLIVDPDLSRWTWKDHDEYAHARRLGVVTDDDYRAVDLAQSRPHPRRQPASTAHDPPSMTSLEKDADR